MLQGHGPLRRWRRCAAAGAGGAVARSGAGAGAGAGCSREVPEQTGAGAAGAEQPEPVRRRGGAAAAGQHRRDRGRALRVERKPVGGAALRHWCRRGDRPTGCGRARDRGDVSRRAGEIRRLHHPRPSGKRRPRSTAQATKAASAEDRTRPLRFRRGQVQAPRARRSGNHSARHGHRPAQPTQPRQRPRALRTAAAYSPDRQAPPPPHDALSNKRS